MLLQDYLKTHGLAALQDKLKIQVAKHPTEPLCIFNYHQLDSPRRDPVARECRGTVLELDSWKLVARCFNRFFNIGEMLEEPFDWSDFTATTKEDGSLVMLYNYKGKWFANTRGSYGLDLVRNKFSDEVIYWKDLIWPLFDPSRLNPELNYICELITEHNHNITPYSARNLFLLSAFRQYDELSEDQVDFLSKESGLERPKRHNFTSEAEAAQFVLRLEETNPTCEGLVLRDKNNNRRKWKTRTYWGLHHMLDTGNFEASRILPFVMVDRGEELFSYFPEVRKKFGEMRDKVLAEWDKLRSAWEDSKDIVDQKEFAKFVSPKTKFHGLLFIMRRNGETTLEQLERRWRESDVAILKALKS